MQQVGEVQSKYLHHGSFPHGKIVLRLIGSTWVTRGKRRDTVDVQRDVFAVSFPEEEWYFCAIQRERGAELVFARDLVVAPLSHDCTLSMASNAGHITQKGD